MNAFVPLASDKQRRTLLKAYAARLIGSDRRAGFSGIPAERISEGRCFQLLLVQARAIGGLLGNE